ncbi:glutathione-dependent formaldehyde dehydrogenase, partial [Nostoc sp. 'Peltigera malacea cyanobiont' DB3992]
KKFAKAEVINYEEVNAGEALKEMTGGRGPDACIDAVGLEAHGVGLEDFYDQTNQKLKLETDRPHVLREMMVACRKGGTLSIMGVYGGFVDKIPLGAAFNKGLTFRMGQMHGQKYMHSLLQMILDGKLDPSFVVTHQLPLEQAPHAYHIFQQKKTTVSKLFLNPK